MMMSIGPATMLSTTAAAQVLDLGGDERPAIGDQSIVNEHIRSLDREIQTLRNQKASLPEREAHARLLLDARIELRRILGDLALASLGNTPSQSRTFLHAVTLLDAREQLDTMLAEIRSAPSASPSDDAPSTRILLLQVFVRSSSQDPSDRFSSLPTPADVDRAVATRLMPLYAALAPDDRFPPPDFWSLTPKRAADIQATELEQLDLASLGLSESARDAFLKLRDAARSALAMPELRTRASDLLDLLTIVAQTAEAITIADRYLTDDHAATLRSLLSETIVRYNEGDDARAHAERTRRALRALNGALRETLALDEATNRRVSVAPIRNVLVTLADALDEPRNVDRITTHLELLTVIAQRMNLYRTLLDETSRGTWRITVQKIARAYEDTEQTLLRRLDRLNQPGSVLADPAFNAVYTTHRQHLVDLRRIQQIPAWLDFMRSVNRRATPEVERRIDTLVARLLEPALRDEAVRTLDQFAFQVDLFSALPFVDQIRERTDPALRLTGGQEVALGSFIDRALDEWVVAWARGDAGGSAADALIRCARLGYIMQELNAIGVDESNAEKVNRWAGWHVPASMLLSMRTQAESRVVLAVQSLVRKNLNDVDAQIARINHDAATLRLAGRLLRHLTVEALDAMPNDAFGLLGQVCNPPADGPPMLLHRDAIADVCRYAVEARTARDAGNGSLAEACTDLVARRAMSVLDPLTPDEAKEFDPLQTSSTLGDTSK